MRHTIILLIGALSLACTAKPGEYHNPAGKPIYTGITATATSKTQLGVWITFEGAAERWDRFCPGGPGFSNCSFSLPEQYLFREGDELTIRAKRTGCVWDCVIGEVTIPLIPGNGVVHRNNGGNLRITTHIKPIKQ